MTTRGVTAGRRIPLYGIMLWMMVMMRMNLPLLTVVVEAFSLWHPSPPPPPPATLLPPTAAATAHDTMCVSRRHTWSTALISLSTAILTVQTPLVSAAAAAATEPKTLTETEWRLLLHHAFTNLGNELQAPNGGVQTLQQFIENQDYPAIIEYTKTYDPILRKGKMKPIQALLLQQQPTLTKEQQSQLKDRMTYLSNAISFDLIGLNQNARPSRENAAQCDYYLHALRADLQQFLNLEPPP